MTWYIRKEEGEDSLHKCSGDERRKKVLFIAKKGEEENVREEMASSSLSSTGKNWTAAISIYSEKERAQRVS